MEDSENQLVDNLEDSSENGDKMIFISSSEVNKQDDDSAEIEDDDETEEEDELEESTNDEINDAKENDDNVAAESSVVETIEKNTPKPVAKKTKKKDKGNTLQNQWNNLNSENSFFFVCVYVEEEGGILDLVVSAFTGEDDDESEKTKTEVRYFKLVWFMVIVRIILSYRL